MNRPRLFFCYHQQDRAEVERLAHLVWQDDPDECANSAQDEYFLGEVNIESMPRAVEWSRFFVLCVGRSGLSEFQRKQVEVALRLGKEVIPVMLPGFRRDASLPPSLAEVSWLDMRGGYTKSATRILAFSVSRGLNKHDPHWSRLDFVQNPELVEEPLRELRTRLLFVSTAAILVETTWLWIDCRSLQNDSVLTLLFRVGSLVIWVWLLYHWFSTRKEYDLSFREVAERIGVWTLRLLSKIGLRRQGMRNESSPQGKNIDEKGDAVVDDTPMPVSESVALFAGLNALMSALQVWQRERDYKLAKETFRKNFESNKRLPQSVAAGRQLDSIAPAEVVKRLHDNAKRCWDHWLETEDSPQMPGQEREADEAVKNCVCRQLKRIIDLNGSLPSEWNKQWDNYSCSTRK